MAEYEQTTEETEEWNDMIIRRDEDLALMDWEAFYAEKEKCEAAAERLPEAVFRALRRIVQEQGYAEQNGVTSPVALLATLLSLARETRGDTRQQILDTLGINADEIESILSNLTTALTAHTDGTVCELATSLWVDETLPIRAVYPLAERGVQTVRFDAEETLEKITAWLDQHTGGLLKQETNSLGLGKETVAALYSALFLKSNWWWEFDPKKTKKMPFHTKNGAVVLCDFMRQRSRSFCLRQPQFKAVNVSLHHSYGMVLLLPAVGIDPAELLHDDKAMRALTSGVTYNDGEADVNLYLPKFDVTDRVDLIDRMKSLGITAAFEPEMDGFALAEQLYISSAAQATRVKIDEQGLEGGSYVEVGIAAGCLPSEPEKVEFRLDRPFLFSVLCNGNLPLFIGTIQNPAE